MSINRISERAMLRQLESLLNRAGFKDIAFMIFYDGVNDQNVIRIKGPSIDRTLNVNFSDMEKPFLDFSMEILMPFVKSLGAP